MSASSPGNYSEIKSLTVKKFLPNENVEAMPCIASTRILLIMIQDQQIQEMVSFLMNIKPF
jgi:hypothetical protein